MKIVHSNIKKEVKPSNKKVSRKLTNKQRYTDWLENEQNRIFRNACKDIKDTLEEIEKHKPGYTEELKRKLFNIK